MPVYAQIMNFTNLVKAANPGFRLAASSLQSLFTVLNNPAGTALQVTQRIAALPAGKTRQYIDPLYYLLSTYPGLPANAATQLNLGPPQTTQAYRFTQGVVPPNFTPTAPNPNNLVFVTSPLIQATGCTLEQYILQNQVTTSLLLIHISSHEPGMDLTFDGRATLKHIISVIRTARLTHVPICVLTMEAHSDVHPRMRPEYNQFPVHTRVYEPATHTTGDVNFVNFVTARPNLVVMGFDATVCVFANVFGCSDTNPDGSFRTPLLARANIVMSRAGLVTTGTVTANTPTFGQAEYGPIWNT